MTIKYPAQLIIFLVLIISFDVFAYEKVTIDGINGFVGSYLIKHLNHNQVTAGCYDCNEDFLSNVAILKGNIRDPLYLKSILDGSQIYFQIAALSSMESTHTLEDYILTNALAPYLASRINQDLTIVTISTIAVNDIEQDVNLNNWIYKFVSHVNSMDINALTMQDTSNNINDFIIQNPLPKIKEYQYYGFSKLLMEKLLLSSSEKRNGKVYIFRSALIVGDGINNRKGNVVVKSIMDTIFNLRAEYDVWNRINYFTSIHKLKDMILHVTSENEQFGKFEIFDAGWVVMEQHDFAKLILKQINHKVTALRLVKNSKFERKVSMRIDNRLQKFYPNELDIELAINDMIMNYEQIN